MLQKDIYLRIKIDKLISHSWFDKSSIINNFVTNNHNLPNIHSEITPKIFNHSNLNI